ncbi:MAG TPA: M1 family metallopeptidase [Gemmatimonadales bacterium]|nr:M1 family metallopeptidase [Gemmatimonadales bacterium]
MRFLLLAALCAAPAAAQQPTTPPTPASPAPARRPQLPPLRTPTADTGVFQHLDLAPGNEVRTADGRPGPRYWQQRADYDIRATLDTAAKTLTGTVRITYTNHSPDTLAHVYLQLDQNLFRQGSVGSRMFPASSRFGTRGFDGGFTITRITQETAPAAGPRARAARPRSAALTGRTDDTMMYLPLAMPLAPGARTVLVIEYSFLIPEHGADRMGRDGALYELAQWYPRMAVYDDIRGWNTDQYLGQGEFYLEYGDYTYAVTVPAGYIVAGTGMVQNPAEVYTAAQRARLATALRSDTTIHIITAQELADGSARPRGAQGTTTWRFKAANVRDVAWAASPDYLFDASGWNGIYAFAYYRAGAAGTWADGARMSRFSIKEYSERWFPYPYPQISAVEGPISGMEYPMVAMEAPSRTKEGLYNVVTHEIGHMWYPMIVGSNERLYAWMDEGFNTFINTFSEEDYWSRSDTLQRRGEQRFVMVNDQAPTAQPIMTPANRYRTNGNLGSLAYVKPSITLLTLRNVVLGPEVFDPAFREYTRRWAFKHPTPADFFRTMEDLSGRDLSWFWREYFYTTATVDQAVDSVTNVAGPNGNTARIVLKNNGAAVLPVQMTLTLDDGSTQRVDLPVEIWYYDQTRFQAEVATSRPVTKVQLWTGGWVKDYVGTNDTWTATP